MNTDKYLEDIHEIKTMMSRSSKFMSLSGLSGILAGIFAIIGSAIAFIKITAFKQIFPNTNRKNVVDTYTNLENNHQYFNELKNDLIIIALFVLITSILTGLILSYRKSRQQQSPMWNATSKRFLINFLIPLITGGLFILAILNKRYYDLIVPSTLIFYGISCIMASKYTYRDIKYLGAILITLGLIATFFIGFGIELWTLGFGLCHIIFGGIIYLKYDRNNASKG